MLKKVFASVMALFLILSAVPVFAEEAPIQVKVQDAVVAFPDAQPFMQDDEVMLPVYFVFEALGHEVIWNDDTKEVTILGETGTIQFKPGENHATMDGVVHSFGAASFIQKNRTYVPLSFIHELTHYTAVWDEEGVVSLSAAAVAAIPQKALDFIEMMSAGQFQELTDTLFDEQMKAAISPAELEKIWLSVASADTAYRSIELLEMQKEGAYEVIVVAVLYEEIGFDVTLAFNEQEQLAGLFISGTYSTVEVPLPDGIVEEEIIVGEGTEYELPGTLTLPANAEGLVPAVVLVQGSGPSDRDESAAAYKPFRDIAWGLAEQGIASIRYDKRTYVHGEKLSLEGIQNFTVKSESVDDAILAADLAKSDARIDASQVYLIGHSQGGMLAPRIDAEGGDFAGLVILAGTPRTLWEVIYDQNMAMLAEMEMSEADLKATTELVESEMAKARAIKDLTDEEAMASVVFGIPAYYFKEMDSHDAGEYALQSEKPMLILQGEDDFQVYADVDYVLWQELLAQKDNVEFKLYPGLNHFFIAYEGEGKMTLAEYNHPGQVELEVIQDIADWILQNK